MKKFKTLIKEHKKAALIALFLAIVFIGGSAVSAVNVANRRAEQAQTESPAAVTSDEKNTDETEKADEGNGEVALTDSQKEAIEGYDADTKEFIETLSASVWSAGSGRYSLRFSDDSYVETVNGEATTHSYAITRIDKTSDGYGGSYDTVVFETDTGTHVVTYIDGKGSAVKDETGQVEKDDSTVIASLTSASMFAEKNTPYERADAVENITIKGLNSEITQLLGGDTDKLTSELSKWCAVNYPATSEATWSNAVIIDYEEGIISTNFTLNTEPSVSIAMTYQTADGTFTFSS